MKQYFGLFFSLLILSCQSGIEEARKPEDSNFQVKPIEPITKNIISQSVLYEANIRQYSSEGTFNAFANGEIMVFSLRMAKWLIQNETGAAIVFAHELGHNANKHVADKIQNANTGALLGLLVGIYVGLPQDMMEMGQSIGATAYSIEYENEADYLSMYILAQAGYNLDDAVNFWRRFAVEVPNSIYSTGGTHPSTAERYVRMESTIKEIKDKISKGEKLIPSYKKE